VRISEVKLRPGDVVRLGDSIFLFEIVDKRAPAPPPVGADELASRVPAMHALERDMIRVAASTVPVLVLGETGSGKDVLCRRIHARSKRAGAFVAVNCGAVSSELAEAYFFGHKRGAFTGAQQDAAGVFVSADEGTVFLDELGELPYELQAKILRVLDSNEVVPVGATHPVKVAFRLIAATNVDLVARVQANEFRRDLYARVGGMVLRVPPLRERKADILPLLRWFWPRPRPCQLSAGFVEKLLLHDWSMNVRELRALVNRLLLHETDAFDVHHFDLDPMPQTVAIDANEPTAAQLPPRDRLLGLLRDHRGNVAQVAKRLGVDRKQIYRWMRKHDISASERAGK
jgi:transcriptional regulator with PAS, ATPase and Fis domain